MTDAGLACSSEPQPHLAPVLGSVRIPLKCSDSAWTISEGDHEAVVGAEVGDAVDLVAG